MNICKDNTAAGCKECNMTEWHLGGHVWHVYSGRGGRQGREKAKKKDYYQDYKLSLESSVFTSSQAYQYHLSLKDFCHKVAKQRFWTRLKQDWTDIRQWVDNQRRGSRRIERYWESCFANQIYTLYNIIQDNLCTNI